MKNRPPILLLTVLALAISMLPTMALARFDGGRDRPIEVSAQDLAPLGDLSDRTSAAQGTGSSTASAGSQVIVRGGGWGHGIGMSQWGAQAMAQAGSTHQQIISHFYTGAQFGALAPAGDVNPISELVRVGIGPDRLSVSFIPENGPGQLCVMTQPPPPEEPEDPEEGDPETPEPVETCFTTEVGSQWYIYSPASANNPGEHCLVTRGPTELMAEALGCTGTLTWENQPATRMRFPGIGRTYARGTVGFAPMTVKGALNGRIQVTVDLPMDQYLYGLGEVPNNWNMEALKAQVVTARTFATYRMWAVRNNPGGLLEECGCQLRATTADQSYLGWATNGLSEGDNNTTNAARWRQAVDETSGVVLWHTFQGKSRAMESFYFSSTGGATENNEDRWGGSAYPYLRSVPDPGATSWSKGFTFNGFASALGMQAVTWVDIAERYASGRPKTIIVHGTKSGQQVAETFSPAAFTAALGLTSQTVHSIEGFMPEGADRVALHDPTTGRWTMRLSDGSTHTFYFGDPGDIALFGDWDGDGTATVGLYRQSDGYVYLSNINDQGFASNRFYFGLPGDIPIVGDFDGDGKDTVSIYRPSEQRFYITNQLGNDNAGFIAEYSFVYGNPGDMPFAGDWDGDGVDSPGLRRPDNGFVYLRNSNDSGVADVSFYYGVGGDVVFSGDWDADGVDGLGLYRPSSGTVYLRNALSTGPADISYQMGSVIHRAVAGAH